MVKGEAVLARAQEIIALHESGVDEQELIRVVEDYCELFAQWQQSSIAGDLVSSGFQETEGGLLSSIAEYNERVMSIVGAYLHNASGILSDVLKRNRAVRAYVDVLPQRISLGRPKKG
jgi:hypothetical protein